MHNLGFLYLFSLTAACVAARATTSLRSLGLAEGEDACYFYKNVDFVGNDVGHARGAQVQDCCEICQKKPGCKAYSWNSFEGGTCWLKSKRGDKIVFKLGVHSADAFSTGVHYPQVVALERGVEYPGGVNDIKTVPGKTVQDCVDPCVNGTGHACTTFTWSAKDGGTCYLKRWRGEPKANSDEISGVISSPNTP